MKKLFYFFLSITIVLSACKKTDDYIFSQSPDQRINAALAKYQAQLTGAANGWKGFIENKQGDTYAFYFKFTNDNRVQMLSDFTSESATILQNGGYRFREEQQPTLIFDTYSYVHVLADPNEQNAGIFADINLSRTAVLNTWYYSDNDMAQPDISVGRSTDFEYIIDESLIKQDTIQMIGKINGSKLTFIRATKAEADIFTSGQWNSTLVDAYLNKEFLTYFTRLNIGGNAFDVHSYSDTTITFDWLDGTNLVTKTVGFKPTVLNDGFTHGIELSDAISNGSITLDTLSILSWDSTSRTLNVSANNTPGTFTETAKPLKIDAAAPTRWNRYPVTNDGYWSTYDGFYVNGVRDAFSNNKDGIDTRFYQLAYFPPAYFGSTYNILAPIFLTADYSSLTVDYLEEMSFTTTAGIMKFRLRNNYGYPTTGNPGLTLNQFVIPEGYYLVQIDATHYDMVSAKDGKVWLSWVFPF